MEKKTPHTRLHVVQALVAAGKVRATRSALDSAIELDIDFDGMCAIIMALTSKDFFKSMTSYESHKVWQDVYRPVINEVMLYVKVTVIDDVLIVSFKEK